MNIEVGDTAECESFNGERFTAKVVKVLGFAKSPETTQFIVVQREGYQETVNWNRVVKVFKSTASSPDTKWEPSFDI